MSDDYNDLNLNDENDDANGAPPPSTGSNRTFVLAAGILGGIFLLALLAVAAYALLILPRQRAAREAQIAQMNANNTATVQVLTQSAADAAAQTAIAKAPTATVPAPTATRAVATATQVVAVASPTPQTDPTQLAARSTATVAALLTQVAQQQLTTTPGTPGAQTTATALPTTGFADDVGIPGLFGLALVLIAVIFLVRRLRSS